MRLTLEDAGDCPRTIVARVVVVRPKRHALQNGTPDAKEAGGDAINLDQPIPVRPNFPLNQKNGVRVVTVLFRIDAGDHIAVIAHQIEHILFWPPHVGV